MPKSYRVLAILDALTTVAGTLFVVAFAQLISQAQHVMDTNVVFYTLIAVGIGVSEYKTVTKRMKLVHTKIHDQIDEASQ